MSCLAPCHGRVRAGSTLFGVICPEIVAVFVFFFVFVFPERTRLSWSAYRRSTGGSQGLSKMELSRLDSISPCRFISAQPVPGAVYTGLTELRGVSTARETSGGYLG